MALDPTGFTAKTTNEWLEQIRTRIRSSPSFGPFSNLRPASRLGTMAGIVAEIAGEVSENQQALYDQRSRDNAVGASLDNLAGCVGLRRRPSFASTAFVRFTGSGPVPVGALVEISATGDQFAVVNGAASIPASPGYVDVIVRALIDGPIIIQPNDIDTLVTPLPGVTGVTNPNNGFSGAFVETDTELRWRMEFDNEASGCGTTEGIRTELEERLSSGSFIVGENPSPTDFFDPATGWTILAYSIAVIAYPPTLDDAQIASTIWETRAGGTPMSGDQFYDILDSVGITHTMAWFDALEVPLEVIVDLSGEIPDPDFPYGSAEDTVKADVTSYTAAVSIAKKWRPFEVVVSVDEVLPAANEIVVSARRKGSGDPFVTTSLPVGLGEKFIIEDPADITYIAPPPIP